MNRLSGLTTFDGKFQQAFPQASTLLAPAVNIPDSSVCSLDAAPEQGSFSYHLIAPIHYEPNYAYPLLVWLHSAGDDERQLRTVLPHISMRNYVAIAPRAVVPEPNGYTYTWSSPLDAFAAAWRSVQDAITVARRQYNVNPDRIFLAGLHEGGSMALRLALCQVEQFAGAVSIGGPFPMNCGALRRLESIRNLPLLICRGMESLQYPEEQVCEELRLFHAASLKVHLRQYTCGHELMTPMLRDLDAWLMEQVTGMPTLSASDAAVI